MTKEELKQKYDGKKIGEIEKEISENRGLSFTAQREITYALCYLRMSGRFKENPQYKNSSFETYLKGQFNMRLTTYMENEHAILFYPEVAEKYGVGLVAKVRRQCGVRKEKQIFKEIEESQGKAHINQAKIEAIIKKHSKPKEPKAPAIDWQAKYEAEAEAHRETKRQLKEAREQIERLKATVMELRPLRDMKAAIEPFMIPRTEQRIG